MSRARTLALCCLFAAVVQAGTLIAFRVWWPDHNEWRVEDLILLGPPALVGTAALPPWLRRRRPPLASLVCALAVVALALVEAGFVLFCAVSARQATIHPGPLQLDFSGLAADQVIVFAVGLQYIFAVACLIWAVVSGLRASDKRGRESN
jgi:hypothetical protein